MGPGGGVRRDARMPRGRRGDRRQRGEETGRPSKAGAKAGTAAAKATAEPVSWLSSLDEGYRRALADRKPLLIVVAAKWCAACRKLSGELETAAVEAELARWTPVRLDLDAQADDASELAVVDVPALRIRTADGQHVAGRDGYVAADELVAVAEEEL